MQPFQFEFLSFSFMLNPSPLPDTKYQIVNVESFVGLNGWTSTIIRQRCHFLKTHSVPPRYNTERSQWEATSTEKGDFLATSKASKQTLLLGTQTWTFENDSHECSQGVMLNISACMCDFVQCADREPYSTQLSLTACNDSFFACDTGWYITIIVIITIIIIIIIDNGQYIILKSHKMLERASLEPVNLQ